MLVRDVMTVGVIICAPSTGVKDITQLMLGAHIGGLPVVENDRLVGIVTSSDILPLVSVPLRRTAAEVMHPDPICLTEETTVASAARTLSRNHIKRAPVVRAGRLVGIVTRSDLLRPYLRTDSEINAEIEDAVLVGAMGLSPRDFHIDVRDGMVTIEGTLPDPSVTATLMRLVRAVDGVVGASEHLYSRPPKLASRAS